MDGCWDCIYIITQLYSTYIYYTTNYNNSQNHHYSSTKTHHRKPSSPLQLQCIHTTNLIPPFHRPEYHHLTHPSIHPPLTDCSMMMIAQHDSTTPQARQNSKRKPSKSPAIQTVTNQGTRSRLEWLESSSSSIITHHYGIHACCNAHSIPPRFRLYQTIYIYGW